MSRLRQLLASPLFIFLIALTARCLYLTYYLYGKLVPAGEVYKIGYETGSIAASIAAGHGFSSPLSIPSGPSAWITPIYPYLLAGIFKLCGTFTFTSNVTIRLFDVLFSSLTCLPIYSLGRRLFGGSVGMSAAWIWVFLPGPIYFSVAWVWDTSLSTLSLALALLLTYLISERQEARAWLGYGVAWGLTALVNAAVLSVLPGCFAFAVYRARQKGISWFRPIALTVFAFAITVSPWIIRNQMVFHHQVLFRSNFGLELWLGNNPQVPDSWSWWLHPNDNKEERERYVSMGEVPYMQEKERLAIEFIKSHPADFSRFVFHRFMENWSGSWDSLADNWSSGQLSARTIISLNYAFTLLAFLGLLLAHRKDKLLSLPLLNLLVVFPLVYYICHPSLRYRHPIDPAMTILVAYAIVCVVRLIQAAVQKNRLVLQAAPRSQSETK